MLFGFVYPNERSKIPENVMRDLVSRLNERDVDSPAVCLGTFLSRVQYLPDLNAGYQDGRLILGSMSPEEIARWTAAAKPR